MLLTSLALVLSLQSSGETVIAVRNDDPETWSVEYPRLIRPYVAKYRQCLNVSNRSVRGEADFEAQHRTDIPRCAKERDAAMADARAAMLGAKTQLSEDELNTLFRNLGRIHIARGRDLDKQFTDRVAASERSVQEYNDNKPKGLVMELVDGSVVKSRLEIEAADKTKADDTPKNRLEN